MPRKSPEHLAQQQLLKQHTNKLRLLFRNARTVSKNKKSLADYQCSCDLDEVKGLTVVKTRQRGVGVYFWASENWSGQVHFEGHLPEWRVL